MKKSDNKSNIYLAIGMIIYFVTLIVDRVTNIIPDIVYIGIMLVVIALFIISIIKNKK